MRGPSSLPPCLLSVSFLVPFVCIPLFCLLPSESSAPSYFSLKGGRERGREGGREGGERVGWRKGRNDGEWEGWRLRGREEESEGGMDIAKEYERGRELLQQMERRPAGRGGGWNEEHREEGREKVSESARNGGSDE